MCSYQQNMLHLHQDPWPGVTVLERITPVPTPHGLQSKGYNQRHPWTSGCINTFADFWPLPFYLLVKFVSSRLQQFDINMMVIQGLQPLPTAEASMEILGLLDQKGGKFHSQGQTREDCPCQLEEVKEE